MWKPMWLKWKMVLVCDLCGLAHLEGPDERSRVWHALLRGKSLGNTEARTGEDLTDADESSRPAPEPPVEHG